jgi:ubiquinone/menaquinone biosynthesis C-methylase UbiE
MSSVCPWYLGYFLINPLRFLVHRPSKILRPHVKPGAVVFEPGPGMGFFTLELARRVGPEGRVHVVDIQPKMLKVLEGRAEKAGVRDRIETRLAKGASLGVENLAGRVDFVLAFAMVHEMPDAARFFVETSAVLKKGGHMLLAEPRGHVRDAMFAEELEHAARNGLHPVAHPSIWGSHAVVLEKG